MFEALEKELQRRERQLAAKDLFYDESDEHRSFYDTCSGIEFYNWQYLLDNNETEHDKLARRTNNRCCFNHLIGLPKKHGVKHHLYEYEYRLFKELKKPKPNPTEDDIITRQQHKHLAVLKATGIGITEFFLRWIAWECVRNDELKGQRVAVVVGPNLSLAITLIRRLKALFLNPDAPYQLIFDSKETEIVINGVEIRAYPSHHLDAMSGFTNVAIVFQDEASFFELNQANDAIDVSHRYIAKSNPWLIVVSTPNRPGDLMHQIFEQGEENCIYKRIYLPYTVGVGNIFSQKEIEIAKRSTSFEREFNLKFLGLIGNVFLPDKIDAAIKLGRKLDIYKRVMTMAGEISNNPDLAALLKVQFFIGVDAGFGSSKFATVLLCIMESRVCVIESIELEREEFNVCIDTVTNLMVKYDLTRDNTKIFIDGSAPSVVTAIKTSYIIDEPPDYLDLVAHRKKTSKLRDPYYDMTVVPVNFNTAEKKAMLINLKDIVDSQNLVLDLERHANIVLALRTAQATDMILDKAATQSDDVLDALTLACRDIRVNR